MLLAAVVGAPAIFVLFGRDYRASIPSFLVLLPGIAALGGASILSGDLAVRQKPKYSMWTAYATLAINIVLNFILIPIAGIVGSALASTVSYCFACCMALLFYRHVSKTQLRQMLPKLHDCRYLFRVGVEMLKQLWRRLLNTRRIVQELSDD
jgi:O-antigen/teichoic acid export membrane protein